MELKSYNIVPTNEGQDLNYIESFNGTLAEVKKKAREMKRCLQNIMTKGTIGCYVTEFNYPEKVVYEA